ncbi:hypothetical protein NQ315_003720 [Exocentrus adspersus]|uniref:Uncharacterized protein n=1 Tax=Exocentrus adspersus TaxID=1586481 RepID=A0AAV8V653_9CUCU|nr:hypothetical protein NQ315_003720 [Exocentrus adspersus]
MIFLKEVLNEICLLLETYKGRDKEPDRYLAQLGVLTNVIDQIYYPIEKMAWLAEHKLVSGINNSRWDTASSICWVLSIYLTLVK